MSKNETTAPEVSLPTAPAENAPTATYPASCHCGTFKYSVTASPPLTDPSAQVIQCNCSICTRNGYLFIYVPNDRITFSQGDIHDFRSYSFASKKMGHYFCSTCGASCMARSKEADFLPGMTCVNVRMLQGVDIKALNLKFADGASFDPSAAA